MKNTLKTSILAGISSLLLFISCVKDSELTDIAKPHLGVYECTQAQLGSLDCLEHFSDVRLELTDEENFTLFYKEKRSERKKVEGKYRYDKERSLLVMEDEKAGFYREFPLEKGKITVSLPVGGKLLVMLFERK